MKLVWLGHATFLLESNKKHIYIDPVVDPSLGPKGLPLADVILVSHWHHDHCSINTIKKIQQDSTVMLGTRETAAELLGVQALTAGDERDFDWLSVKAAPAHTIRKPGGHTEGYTLGFVLTLENKKLYYTADTDFLEGMEKIKAEVTIIPVGGTYTMGAKEAAAAIRIMQPKYAVPMHYGRMVGVQDDAELFKELVEAQTDTKVIILKEGESVEL